jgi:hypothetical protein
MGARLARPHYADKGIRFAWYSAASKKSLDGLMMAWRGTQIAAPFTSTSARRVQHRHADPQKTARKTLWA